MQEDKDPYSNYDLDDCQWEFLRRNRRYIKAYKAIEWLKKRLNKKKEKDRRAGTFNAFGVQCSFSWRRHGEDEVWYEHWVYHGSTYRTKTGEIRRNNLASGTMLELPSPDFNANEYKEELARSWPTWFQKSNYAVVEIIDDRDTVREDLLRHHEIAVVIDMRHAPKDIVSEIETLLQEYQSRKRQSVKLYPDYLAVWDRRNEGLTDTQIAQKLWPTEYATKGGRNSKEGVKGSLMQRVHDHEKSAQKLIENSFPLKRRSPKK
jgi:hypothetical protein